MRVDGAGLSSPHILTTVDGLGRRNYLSVSKCDRHFFSLISLLIKVADHSLLHVLPCASRHHRTLVFCLSELASHCFHSSLHPFNIGASVAIELLQACISLGLNNKDGLGCLAP